MKKIAFLILIWLLSSSLSFTQDNEIGGGIIIGPFANENFGLNLSISHSLDSSKYLQTEFNVVSITYRTNHLKHSSGIYSIEENLIISNDRKKNSVLNEHFLPDISTKIDKFIAINLIRFNLGLTFSL